MVQTRRQASAKRASPPPSEPVPRRRRSRKISSTTKTAKYSTTKKVRFADFVDPESVIEPIKQPVNNVRDTAKRLSLIPSPKKTIQMAKQRTNKVDLTAKPMKSSLKRSLDNDDSPQRPVKRVSLEDISSVVDPPLSLATSTPQRHRHTIARSLGDSYLARATPAKNESIIGRGIFELPKDIFSSARIGASEMGQSLLTPAKRPAQSLRDMTPAQRRVPTTPAREENPFSSTPHMASITASAKRAAATPAKEENPSSSTPHMTFLAASARRGQPQRGLFSTSIGSSTLTKSGLLGSADLAKAGRVFSSSVLATPARRPPGAGISSVTTKKADTSRVVSQPAPMTCPPRRPGVSHLLSTPPKGGVQQLAPKLGNLATPAQRPKYAASPSFARPTQSSDAKASPSPLKKAARRPNFADSTTTIPTDFMALDTVKENISIGGAKPITPKRDSKTARRSSPTRLIQIERRSSVSFVPGLPGVSAPRTPQNKLVEEDSFRPSSVDSFKRRLGISRKLDFSSGLQGRQSDISLVTKSQGDIDIYVDKDAREGDSDEDRAGEDSMTTEEVFGSNPPATLGSRRESGIFLSSPDRAVSIGPFTTRISPKKSPLRAQYTKELERDDMSHHRDSFSGNIFLDSLDRTPKLVHRETFTVPLKG